MEKKQEILEFLKTNLLVDFDISQQIQDSIDTLSQNQINWIYEKLIAMNKEQTRILNKKLEEKPWLFMEIDSIISRESYNSHKEDELEESKQIELWLEKVLNDDTSNYKI